MARQNQIGRHATTVHTDKEGRTTVVYQSTAVVVFDEDTIILDHGGWRTQTTKIRMNQASNQFGLGFRVTQRDFKWFVEYRGKVLDFDSHLNVGVVTLDRLLVDKSD